MGKSPKSRSTIPLFKHEDNLIASIPVIFDKTDPIYFRDNLCWISEISERPTICTENTLYRKVKAGLPINPTSTIAAQVTSARLPRPDLLNDHTAQLFRALTKEGYPETTDACTLDNIWLQVLSVIACVPTLFHPVRFEFSEAGLGELGGILKSDVRCHVVSFEIEVRKMYL